MIYGVPPPEDRLSVWFTASQFGLLFLRSVADKRPIPMAHDLKMPIPAMQGKRQLGASADRACSAPLQAGADLILQEMKLTPDDVFWICLHHGGTERGSAPRSGYPTRRSTAGTCCGSSGA